jgi:SAM-dependent methyltransferase
MTLLAEDPELWDTVFRESPERARFIGRIARRAGHHILDVGCATGSFCRLMRGSGADPVGVDINAAFIRAARAKDPHGKYKVGDMKSFRIRQRFDLVTCLGTTFSYNRTNANASDALMNFARHLRPGGLLVVDVLNPMSFLKPNGFKASTRHKFTHKGSIATASIIHTLTYEQQLLLEQVTWVVRGRRTRHDPMEGLRLFFPQELAFHLNAAGFSSVKLTDRYGRRSNAFDGRRLIAVAMKQVNKDQKNG